MNGPPRARLILTTPFAEVRDDLNLGDAYNRTMRQVDAEWVGLMDYDIEWLTPRFFEIISRAIDEQSGVGLITVKATRTGSRLQQYDRRFRDRHDVLFWREEQERLLQQMRTRPLMELVPPGTKISGHVMIIRSEAWEQIAPAPDGLLGVDWIIAERIREAGWDIGIIPSLIVHHFYRGDGNLDHLHRANRKYVNPYP